MKLATKDTRALIVLGTFLACAGLYHYVVDPMMLQWHKMGLELQQKKKDLQQMRRKIREYRSWEHDYQRLSEVAWDIQEEMNVPPLDADLATRIKAILSAASRAGVKVEALRPLSRLLADGKTYVSESFALEGEVVPAGFTALLQNLKGMHVDELSFSAGGTSTTNYKFHMQLTSLPKWELEGITPPAETAESKAFDLKENPFQVRRIETPPVSVLPPAMSDDERTEPTPVEEHGLNLAGLTLVGINQIGNQRVAVIVEASSGDDLFLLEGDAYQELTVSSISAEKIVFTNAQGETGELQLVAADTGVAALFDRQQPEDDGQSQRHAQGRLGLHVKPLTSALAKERGVALESGLLVLAGRGDFPGIQTGDVVVGLNGVNVASLKNAAEVMYTVAPGDLVQVDIVRSGESQRVSLPAIQ
ncbi:MAG: hypothetical protein C0624_14750 [Desulfuromonas sp.]|nr:MAG: hypothetical protein C0624_14750 [Desulfuromonas sp.]